MPYTSTEAKRRCNLAHYYRKASDSEWRAKQNEKMRKHRASMSPEQKAAYLAKRASMQRARMRADPEYRARQAAAARASFLRRKAIEPDVGSVQARRGYVKNLAWRLASGARVRAEKKGLSYDLTKEWAEKRWTGRCELTGMKFVVAAKTMSPYSPSLDRIDPKLGYTQGNCRFILMGVNSLKNTGTDEDVMRIAEAIVGSRCA